MQRSKALKTILAGGVCALALAGTAFAQTRSFDVPAGDLKAALDTYIRQSGTQLIYRSDDVRGKKTPGAHGSLSASQALDQLLAGSGFVATRDPSGAVVVAKVPQGVAGAPPANEAPQEVAEVVVTGTHIRGVNPTSPVRLIGRAEIEQSGYSQVGDLVRSMPEAFSGGQNPGVIGGSAENVENFNGIGSSTVNLRGLGAGATLTLLNGHRLAGSYTSQGPDISAIPFAALQRVEVVTDGASALYGSDAVAGVVNFITRRNYNGTEVSAHVGGATQGGGSEQTYSALSGVARDDWHALAALQYTKQDEVTAGDRDFTAGAPPANVLSPPLESRSIFLSAGRDLTEHAKISFEGLWGDRDTSRITQNRPTAKIGTNDIYATSYSGDATLDVELPKDWNLRVLGGTATTRAKTHANTSTIATLWSENNTRYAEATADGTLLNLPSGAIKVALGGGYKTEDYQSRTLTSTSNTVTKGDRNIAYFFVEARAPLVSPSETRAGLNELEVSLSARTENYSDFGRTTNPKLGLRWVPFEDLTLHGTWGKSFKAPTFATQYQALAVNLYPASALGYTGAGVAVVTSGGNTELKPETSKSWTIGGDYSPHFDKSFTFSANYFDIDYKDRVVNPVNLGAVFRDPVYAPFVIYSPSADVLAALIARAARVNNITGAPYNPTTVVALISNNAQNATEQRIRGFDVAVSKDFSFSSGQLSVFANGTRLQIRQQNIPTVASITKTGTIFNPPKFKARGGLTWQAGGLSATGIVNYVAGETDNQVNPNANVSSWTTVDATIAYRFDQPAGLAKGMKVALSATNLLDKDPPYALGAALDITGVYYDSTNTSVMGRFISVTLTKAW